MNRPVANSHDKAGAIWQLFVGLALCAGAVSLVYFVSRLAAHVDNVYLRELFVVLHQYGGKWICAGLLALLGLAFCRAAVARIRTAPPEKQRFAEGTMMLQSVQWVNREGGSAASASSPRD